MKSVLTVFVTAAFVATTLPTTVADERDPATHAELVDWLVAHGIVDRAVVEQATVEEYTLEVPEGAAVLLDHATGAIHPVPLALPGLPPREAGCLGMRGQFGFKVEPEAIAPACPLQIHRTPIWADALVCIGQGTCFQISQNLDFAAFGFLLLSCQQPGAIVTVPQLGVSASTLSCTKVSFGANPAVWTFWVGFCGGFGVGVWKCAAVLK